MAGHWATVNGREVVETGILASQRVSAFAQERYPQSLRSFARATRLSSRVKAYSNFTIAVLSRENLSVRPVAERFLSTLMQFPVFAPQLWGNYEPVRTPFVGIEQTLAGWEDPFLWKNNASLFEGS